MRKVAYIINLIFTCLLGILIIPGVTLLFFENYFYYGVNLLVISISIIWCIPITIHSYRVYKETSKNRMFLAIINLLFCNLISGILLLCDLSNDLLED